MGRGYVIDHCISTIKSQHKKEICLNYIADALKYIVTNSSGTENRILIKNSLNDMLHPVTKEIEKDNDKKAKEIKNKICNTLTKLGGG